MRLLRPSPRRSCRPRPSRRPSRAWAPTGASGPQSNATWRGIRSAVRVVKLPAMPAVKPRIAPSVLLCRPLMVTADDAVMVTRPFAFIAKVMVSVRAGRRRQRRRHRRVEHREQVRRRGRQQHAVHAVRHRRSPGSHPTRRSSRGRCPRWSSRTAPPTSPRGRCHSWLSGRTCRTLHHARRKPHACLLALFHRVPDDAARAPAANRGSRSPYTMVMFRPPSAAAASCCVGAGAPGRRGARPPPPPRCAALTSARPRRGLPPPPRTPPTPQVPWRERSREHTRRRRDALGEFHRALDDGLRPMAVTTSPIMLSAPSPMDSSRS